MPDCRYFYDREFRGGNFFGRIARVERIGPPPYGRISIEIDSVRQEAASVFDTKKLYDLRNREVFCILRILTTERKFFSLIGQEPNIGDWLFLQTSNKRPNPIVFHSQLENDGYSTQSRGNLDDATLLFNDKDPRFPSPLGSGVPSNVQMGRLLANNCAFPTKAKNRNRQIDRLIGKLNKCHGIVVHDVGQGSFITISDHANKPIAYFDVGWPVSFNGKTAPKNHSIHASSAPVVLSHWDFDHLLGFYRFPFLQNVKWIVPIQRLGPGAARIANMLASKNNLMGWSGDLISSSIGDLRKCQGPGYHNDNGIAFILNLRAGQKALLSGDASYRAIGNIVHRRFSHLVVTHHGALFEGNAPLPSKKNRDGVVSVGAGNVYKHPRQDAIAKHEARGWSLRFTSVHGLNSRGDRLIKD